MDFIDRSPVLATINYAKGQLLYRLGVQGHHSGSTAAAQAMEDSVEYVRRVASDYVRYGADGDQARLEGRNILEVGPGDNLGVALVLLSLGAASVTSIDGFEPIADPRKNSGIYASLLRGMTPAQRERVQDVATLSPDGTEATLRLGGRLQACYGARIDMDSPTPAQHYDVIVSRAVLEHVGDIEAGWRRMVEWLAPDGEMWHKVDFRSHKMYDRIHPLYFLTFDEKLWKLISSPDPTLNRARLPVYRALLASDFAEWKIYKTRILNEPELQPHVSEILLGRDYSAEHLAQAARIRPELKEPFRSYSDEDLLVNGIFLTARKKRNTAWSAT